MAQHNTAFDDVDPTPRPKIEFPPPYDESKWQNVCDDFIAPLVHLLEQWISCRPVKDAPGTVFLEWFKDLSSIVNLWALGGRTENEWDRWSRANVELEAFVSPEFAGHFKSQIRDMFAKTEAAIEDFSRYRNPKFTTAVVDIFVYIHVESFCTYLRHCSDAARKKLPVQRTEPTAPDPEPNKETEDPFRHLMQWAERALAKKEYLLVKAIIEADGWISLDDCRDTLGWASTSKAHMSAMRRVNTKLRDGKQGWKVEQTSKGQESSGLKLTRVRRQKK